MSAASLVAGLMYFNPKLTEHPGKLIFLMCICEAISVWSTLMDALGVEKIICYFGVDASLLVTAGYFVESQGQAISLISSTNYFVQNYFQLLSLSLNFCLCLDIVLTMGSPFSPHDRRMKTYLLSSLFSAGLLTGLTLNSKMVSQLTLPVSLQQINRLEVKAAIGVIFLSVYIIYAIFSVAYAYRLNTRPGFSAGIRGAFICNHLLYVLAYVLTWVPYMGMCFYIMYTSHSLLLLSS